MNPDLSRLSHPGRPLAAPWTAEQARTHHTPAPAHYGAANEGNAMSAESSRESLARTIEDLHRVIRDRNQQIQEQRDVIKALRRENEALHALAESRHGKVHTKHGVPDPDREPGMSIDDATGIVYVRLTDKEVNGTVTDLAEGKVEGVLINLDLDMDYNPVGIEVALNLTPRPLAVGDRVRVVKADGSAAAGDEGVIEYMSTTGVTLGFRRDGTESDYLIAAANVERIEDER